VFTARYALSPYIKQISFVFKGLKFCSTIILHKLKIRRSEPVFTRRIAKLVSFGLTNALWLGKSICCVLFSLCFQRRHMAWNRLITPWKNLSRDHDTNKKKTTLCEIFSSRTGGGNEWKWWDGGEGVVTSFLPFLLFVCKFWAMQKYWWCWMTWVIHSKYALLDADYTALHRSVYRPLHIETETYPC
jgi:hypothetical protein